MPPAVSILLPAFNTAPTLDACLRSIVRQSDPAFECIVVDDGSADDTLEPRARVRPPRAAPRRGRDAASRPGRRARDRARALLGHVRRAHGRRRSHAPPSPARAARPFSSLDRSSRGRRLPRSACFRARGCSDGLRSYERWLNAIDGPETVRAEAYVECPIAHPALMIRRDVLAAFGYRDRGWPEDYDFAPPHASRAATRSANVPRRLVSLARRPGPPVARATRATRSSASPRARRLSSPARFLAAHRPVRVVGLRRHRACAAARAAGPR